MRIFCLKKYQKEILGKEREREQKEKKIDKFYKSEEVESLITFVRLVHLGNQKNALMKKHNYFKWKRLSLQTILSPGF